MHNKPLGVVIQILVAVCADSDQLLFILFCVLNLQCDVAGERPLPKVAEPCFSVVAVFSVEVASQCPDGFLVCRFIKEISIGISKQNKLHGIDDRRLSGCCFTGQKIDRAKIDHLITVPVPVNQQ